MKCTTFFVRRMLSWSKLVNRTSIDSWLRTRGQNTKIWYFRWVVLSLYYILYPSVISTKGYDDGCTSSSSISPFAHLDASRVSFRHGCLLIVLIPIAFCTMERIRRGKVETLLRRILSDIGTSTPRYKHKDKGTRFWRQWRDWAYNKYWLYCG